MNWKVCLLIPLLISSATVLADKAVNICIDQNYWYPFSFSDNEEAKGLHVDIVRQAFLNLGYAPIFKAQPWKRCLNEAEEGLQDAVVTSSYKEDRAVYLTFPSDASTVKTSHWRVSQVAWVLITAASDPYEFVGDHKTIPVPVNIPAGYSIKDDLRKEGVLVEEAPTTEATFLKLLRSAKGSVVTIPEVAIEYQKRPEFHGKLKVQKLPLSSKSYFVPFSKKSHLSSKEEQAVWNEVAKLRDNGAFMSELLVKYP